MPISKKGKKTAYKKKKDYLKSCFNCLDYFYGPTYKVCLRCRVVPLIFQS